MDHSNINTKNKNPIVFYVFFAVLYVKNVKKILTLKKKFYVEHNFSFWVIDPPEIIWIWSFDKDSDAPFNA